MFKRAVTIAAVTASLAAAPSALAADDAVRTIDEAPDTAVERFFYRVWSSIRSVTPQAAVTDDNSRVIATAGLRGAEGDGDGMAPYWKGDLTADPEFRARLEAYREAIAQGEQGDPEGLRNYLGEYGDSDLAANARFALAVVHARANQPGEARTTLQAFIERYPQHPLMPQARALQQRL